MGGSHRLNVLLSPVLSNYVPVAPNTDYSLARRASEGMTRFPSLARRASVDSILRGVLGKIATTPFP